MDESNADVAAEAIRTGTIQADFGSLGCAMPRSNVFSLRATGYRRQTELASSPPSLPQVNRVAVAHFPEHPTIVAADSG